MNTDHDEAQDDGRRKVTEEKRLPALETIYLRRAKRKKITAFRFPPRQQAYPGEDHDWVKPEHRHMRCEPFHATAPLAQSTRDAWRGGGPG
jgi:hypothetical protein